MKSRAAFPLLQLANVVSGVSNGVVMITVPWIVLEKTGSAGRAGLLAALVSIPGIVVSPIVGGLIDRLGRRLVSVVSDVMSLVSVLLFVLVNAVGDLTYWWIVAIAILGAVFDPAGYTARKSLIPNAATASGVSVDAANGRHEGLFAIGWMVGPAIGAACIEWSGPMASFIVTAVFFAIAAVAVSNMKVNDEHGKSVAHEDDGHEPFFSSLRGGFRVIAGDRALLGLTITFVILSGLYMPIDTVIFPAHFESIDDPSGLGLLLASLALGMVIGSFSYGRLSARFTSSQMLRTIVVVSTCSLFPMVALPSKWVFGILGLISGLSWGPFNPLWNTVVQKRVEPNLQGRVYGIQMSVLSAAPPLGQLIVGASVDGFGLQPTFLVVMIVFVVAAISISSSRTLRHL
ncbi:MAG: MFS transporter [Actinobacteria bacterium]|nr:MFS transporter [Actinomycetota bacterium]NBY12957.1 MFS transporter [Actinomycetota bacterium]